MKWYNVLPTLKTYPFPFFLTIGHFDGVHLGHQKVISTLSEKAKKAKGSSMILTFSNHPKEIVGSGSPPLLTSPFHKKHLLSTLGADIGFFLNFTKELSLLSPHEFIHFVRKSIPFEELVLGYDAVFGKNREGTREVVTSLGEKERFHVDYVDPVMVENVPVSSTRIRNFIQQGQLLEAKKLLGRDYSFYGQVKEGEKKGKSLGFPTANMDVSGLCLPPFGVYAILAKVHEKLYHGIANLGVAPTFHESRSPLLESFLFDFEGHLYDSFIEVILYQFIREEKKFSDPSSLKVQIQNDIEKAKSLF